MTEVQIFQMPGEDKPLRVVMIDGEPWFVAADVAFLLGYRDASHAVRLLKSGEKRPHLVGTPGGGQQEMIIISEPGFYRLVMRSNRPEADAFQTWVTSEVLPTIRKTGGYGSAQKALSRMELLELAMEAEKEAMAARGELEAARPALDAHASYMRANNTVAMGTAAKVLGVGPNRLFALLRENKILISTAGARHNTPYQAYIELGWFEVKAGSFEHNSGEVEATYTTRVTPKGLEGIRRLLAP